MVVRRPTRRDRSIPQLAKELGVSVNTIRNYVTDRGVGTQNELGHLILSREDQRFVVGILESAGNNDLASKLLLLLGK